jgi:Leucine-rich repeat (LRR) protein
MIIIHIETHIKMIIFTFQLMPPKVIHTIVTGSGLPLAKVCLKGETDPRWIYKKIRETLVEKGIINHNTGLEWTIYDEEIMINHFVDLSDLFRHMVDNCNIKDDPSESIFDITSTDFRNNSFIDKLKYLYNLTELHIIDMIDNEQLIELSHLHNLEILSFSVSANILTNILTIPPEYAGLKKLHTLEIGGRGLGELSPLILDIFENLKVLNLSYNDIRSIDSITQLRGLSKLNLARNRIEELPDNLNQLTCLIDLNLSNNFISEYPLVINQIQTLKILDLSGNNLTTFPPIRLPNLDILALESNEITFNEIVSEDDSDDDSEDDHIGLDIDIPDVVSLDISYNNLSSIPKFIYSLHYLCILHLSDNNIPKSDLDEFKSKLKSKHRLINFDF